jgi:Permease family
MSKGGKAMTSVTPTEQAGSLMAGEGERRGLPILKLRYALEDKPGALATALFGLQHVLVMFAAMIAAPLVIGQLLDLPPDLRATMLSGVMLGCGIGTMVSALGLGFVGARLPIVLGAHSVYIGAVVAMAKASSLADATTAMMLGGLVLFALSPVIGKCAHCFRPWSSAPCWWSPASPSSASPSISPAAPTRLMPAIRWCSPLLSAASCSSSRSIA